ncbi:MAG: hypothetical protein U5K28_01545 [Halobacteriales archaeon]|nr:hypothetical protein [Halobacteriales archaeon]
MAVFLAVALAGCGGLAGDTSTGPIADGYNETGVQNVSVAIQTHQQAVASSRYSYEQTVETGGTTGSFEIHSGPSGTIATQSSSNGASRSVWRDAEAAEVRTQRGGEPVYSTLAGNVSVAIGNSRAGSTLNAAEQFPRTILQQVAFDAAGGTEWNGVSVREYTATGFRVAGINGSVDGQMLVDAEGRIRHIDIDLTQAIQGQEQSISIETSLTDIGSATASEPSWTGDAPSVSVVNEGGILEVTNTGSDALNSTFTGLDAGLDGPLAPDETMYIAPGNNTVSVTRERPDSVEYNWPRPTVALRFGTDRTVTIGAYFSAEYADEPVTLGA